MAPHTRIETIGNRSVIALPAHARRNAHLRAIASQKRLGRILRAARRAFIVSNGEPILARAVLDRAFPRVKRPAYWQRWSVRRALLMEAEVIDDLMSATRYAIMMLRDASTKAAYDKFRRTIEYPKITVV
jgi:hypothetical protein